MQKIVKIPGGCRTFRLWGAKSQLKSYLYEKYTFRLWGANLGV